MLKSHLMSQERQVILLTAGFEPGKQPNKTLPCPPNDSGRYRCEAAAYLALQGLKVKVLGGMLDENGHPVEEGHAQYIKDLVNRIAPNSGLENNVGLFDRHERSWETVGDLRQVSPQLPDKGKNIWIVSEFFHLFPRSIVLKNILNLPEAKLIPAESIHYKIISEGKIDPNILDNPDQYRYPLLKYYVRELALTCAYLSDFVPGLKGIGVDLVSQMADQQRQFYHQSLG